ncbi:hypothetical protein C8A01DRAFT_48742 [Parachaetomium inaequale]|uniref:Uncharacterized protein n=1 Tax=Parachaetomium inaequale TaxID=2588326 RepID=A0AAN6PAX7_9PEZI|nr:hypothetical protein C8A01DRAFT_48742 [Parachaetomium inaequale]
MGTRFIRLKKSADATFGHRASITRKLAETIFAQFDVHNGFMGDLVGRPDYWSAVGRCKGKDVVPEEEFEFFCQHPRWAQVWRYEKAWDLPKSSQGHRAPCSVYMHHSKSRNLTFYLISASETEDWLPWLLQRIGVDGNHAGASREVLEALTSSPFMMHAVISTIAFEQSIEYVANVRERLMSQIKQVNDYSEQGSSSAPRTARARSGMEDRIMLESITKQLHLVSQTADTGIANSHASIKIAERMLEAHSMFMMTKERQKGVKGPAAVIVSDTHTALQYVRNSFYCQKDLLTTYKARKDTAMNFVFNMVTQQDSATNVDISYKMSQDSSSMNAVTVLTLIFLPGTFLSANCFL